MEYDRSDSYPFDSEPNGIPSCSKWNPEDEILLYFRKYNRIIVTTITYSIQFERKWKSIFVSAYAVPLISSPSLSISGNFIAS